jgi:hypothetical protein
MRFRDELRIMKIGIRGQAAIGIGPNESVRHVRKIRESDFLRRIGIPLPCGIVAYSQFIGSKGNFDNACKHDNKNATPHRPRERLVEIHHHLKYRTSR